MLLVAVVALVVGLFFLSSGNDRGEELILSVPQTTLPAQQVDLNNAEIGGQFAPHPPNEASSGDPIHSKDSTPRLPMSDEQKRTLTVPVAAFEEWVVIHTRVFEGPGQQGYEELALWNPRAGKRVQVPEWGRDLDDRNDQRVLGATGEWIVMKISPFPTGPGQYSGADEITLVNAISGQIRTIAAIEKGRLIGAPSVSAGVVAWAESLPGAGGPSRQRIQLYDTTSHKTATLVDVPYEERHFSFGPVKIGGKTVAWTDGSGGSPPDKLFVVDLGAGTVVRYDSPGGNFRLQGISEDGRYVLWESGGRSQFATSLETGATVRYAEAENVTAGTAYAGFSGEQAGPRIAQGSADGGLYDFEKREARPLGEREGCLCLAGGVMGKWFVWLEAAPIPTDAGREPIPIGDFRFMPLD